MTRLQVLRVRLGAGKPTALLKSVAAYLNSALKAAVAEEMKLAGFPWSEPLVAAALTAAVELGREVAEPAAAAPAAAVEVGRGVAAPGAAALAAALRAAGAAGREEASAGRLAPQH